MFFSHNLSLNFGFSGEVLAGMLVRVRAQSLLLPSQNQASSLEEFFKNRIIGGITGYSPLKNQASSLEEFFKNRIIGGITG